MKRRPKITNPSLYDVQARISELMAEIAPLQRQVDLLKQAAEVLEGLAKRAEDSADICDAEPAPGIPEESMPEAMPDPRTCTISAGS